MSYIIDALRRADAERERERGAVPSLNAQPAAAVARPQPRWGPVALGLIGVAAVAGVAVLLWAWPARVESPVASLPRVPAVTAPVQAQATSPAPAPALVPATPAAPAPSKTDPPRVVVAAPAPAAPASMPASPQAAAARPAEPQVTALSELSPELRRSLPVMAIGGAIYSDNPSSRFIVVGGQVVREGESAAPGVTVERIGPKSALIRWNGMRIELPL